MKTKLIKKIGVLALCGVLFCGGMQMTTKAASNDYINYSMSWSLSVKKALGVHYCTSKAGDAGTVYGYTKLERNKKSTSDI